MDIRIRMPTESVRMKRGDLIEKLAQPIAKGLDYALGTNVAGCGGCKQMRDNLNSGMSLTDAIYERWFAAKKGEQMEYVIPVKVEAKNIKEAVAKFDGVDGEILEVRPAPQPKPTPRPGMPTMPGSVTRVA